LNLKRRLQKRKEEKRGGAKNPIKRVSDGENRAGRLSGDFIMGKPGRNNTRAR